jgi:deazaflavin-dependent oxidoreductase (nitroreductase family)
LAQKYSGFHRLVQRLAMTRWGAWLCARVLYRVDRPLLQMSDGKISLTALLAGPVVVTLTTIGAKSGQPRLTPLLSIPDGRRYLLVASNFGQKHFPAWYYNIRANPQVSLTINGNTQKYIGEELDGQAWQQAWETALSIYPGYRLYKERAGRQIPVIRLTPVKPG